VNLLWGAIVGGSSFDAVKKQVGDVVAEGYDMSDLLCRIHDNTLQHDSFADVDKAMICEKIAQV
jgi:hypothetical protein